MTKLKNPLMSFLSRGKLGSISFKKSRATNIAEKTPVVPDAKSPGQLAWRHMFLKCTALWHALSVSEKAEWESLARAKHMTGYAYWQSQCLRPNPGIYLPLQGGTMQGDIDMAKHRILKLPAPSDLQEAFRLSEYTTYVLPFLLREGARVYHDVNQLIAPGGWVALAFNQERYDTDTIHDTVAFNSRLTCKTAGKYLMCSSTSWEANATGKRLHAFRLNGVTFIATHYQDPPAAGSAAIALATIYDLALTDFVEAMVQTTTVGNLNVIFSANASPEFMMQRIGS